MVVALGISHGETRDVGCARRGMVDDGSAGLVQAVAGEMYAAQSRCLVRARERAAYGRAALTLKDKVILYRETKASTSRKL